MKKLVVSKILLLSTIPLLVACGKTSVQSETSPVKNNEITFLAKKAKSPEGVNGLVRLQDGEDLNSVANDVASAEGVNGIVISEKAAAAEEAKAEQADIDAGKRAVNSVAVDEGVNGIQDEGVNGVIAQEEKVALPEGVNGFAAEEGVNGKQGEGVNGFTELDEGVNGIMKRIKSLEEGVNSKQITMGDDALKELGQLDEGVNGLAAQVEELKKKYQDVELDEGVNGLMAEFQKHIQEFNSAVEDLEKIAGIKDEGVNGKVALQKNILIIEGQSSDKEVQELVMVFNGKEKYGIKVNPETLNYGASFELNDEEMKKSVFDLIIGKEVMTFMIIDGQLQDAMKF